MLFIRDIDYSTTVAPQQYLPYKSATRSPREAASNPQTSSIKGLSEAIETVGKSGFLVVKSEDIKSLKFWSLIPSSDTLNTEAFRELGLNDDQISRVDAAFKEALVTLRNAEAQQVSLEDQDDGSLVLKFDSNSPELSRTLENFAQALKKILPDGRAEIVFNNLSLCPAMGYQRDWKKEVLIEYQLNKSGAEIPAIMDNRLTGDVSDNTNKIIGASINPAYFKVRYSSVLDKLGLDASLRLRQ